MQLSLVIITESCFNGQVSSNCTGNHADVYVYVYIYIYVYLHIFIYMRERERETSRVGLSNVFLLHLNILNILNLSNTTSADFFFLFYLLNPQNI